ncbi:MAG TPA: class I SAM-dependent methyltransferase [Dehalococcoidia bacterium]|nr:class I SAM-dependent methyltransferase [Dehalococcoidia bacterium]
MVIETGVAHGFTTAAALQALADNQYGRLISIDLPHLHPRAMDSIGSAVPHELRDRWQLILGSAAGSLMNLPRSDEADIFIQDAAHTIRGQLAEFRAGWSRLREGGLLISDDVGEAAVRFGREVDAAPIFIAQPPKVLPMAIIRR